MGRTSDETDSDAFAIFVAMRSTWRSAIPALLANEDPSLLDRLLELGTRDGGISQSEAQRELGVNQPRLSKLMAKLLRLEWIREEKSGADGRVKMIASTTTAITSMASLKETLIASLPSRIPDQEVRQPPASKRLPRGRNRAASGQQPFSLGE